MESSSSAADGVRVAVVTDIHHGAQRHAPGSSGAIELLRLLADRVAEARPDVVLDLGDRISDHSPERDSILMEEVAEEFRRFAAPVRHLCGNHDVVNLSVADNERILREGLGHEVLDVGGWRIVLWRARTSLDARSRFSLSQGDLDWLERTLAAGEKPLLVASHAPVSGQSQISNYYFDQNPEGATYPEAVEVRRVLQRVSQPIIWVSGHVHWNSLTFVGGVPHLTLQSLTEGYTTDGQAAGAFALLTLGEEVVWRVYGRDPLEVRLKSSRTARRWAPPQASGR